jgi:hypothetical protein
MLLALAVGLGVAEIANDRSGRIEDDYAFETACKRE